MQYRQKLESSRIIFHGEHKFQLKRDKAIRVKPNLANFGSAKARTSNDHFQNNQSVVFTIVP